jgi:hypothetical protein
VHEKIRLANEDVVAVFLGGFLGILTTGTHGTKGKVSGSIYHDAFLDQISGEMAAKSSGRLRLILVVASGTQDDKPSSGKLGPKHRDETPLMPFETTSLNKSEQETVRNHRKSV